MESVREGVEAVCGAKRKWAVREGCSEEATFVLRLQGWAGVSEVRGADKVVQLWALGWERTWTMGLVGIVLKDLT